jgi:ketosteroid isomerase-like protein
VKVADQRSAIEPAGDCFDKKSLFEVNGWKSHQLKVANFGHIIEQKLMTSFTSHRRDRVPVLSACGNLILMIIGMSLGIATNVVNASPEEDVKTVAALDTKYQTAVKANDAATMNQILVDDFVLVTGRGKVSTKADLIESARKKEVTYERQDEEPGTQKVRVWGDTAVVTALLWIKALQGSKPIDYKLWFSDTYVRTPAGWRYVFGQASLPLPQAEPK